MSYPEITAGRWLALAVGVLWTLLSSATSPAVVAQSGARDWTGPETLFQSPEQDELQLGTPVIVADPAGGIHVLWELSGGLIYYTSWHDSGWSDPVDVIAAPGRQASRLEATLDPAAVLHVTWLGSNAVYYSRVSVVNAASVRGWLAPVQLAALDGAWGSAPIVADKLGQLHLVYADRTGQSWSVFYQQSADGGSTWSTPTQVSGMTSSIAVSPRLAVDGEDAVHVVWVEDVNVPPSFGPEAIYYARSTDDGETWTPLTQITSGPDYDYANIVVMSDDSLHVVWSGTRGAPGRFHRWSLDGGQTWSNTLTIMDFWGFTGIAALAEDSGGTLHLFTAANAHFLDNTAPFYSFWNGQQWSEPTLVFDVTESVSPRLAVSEGNILNAVWVRNSARDGGILQEILFSRKETSAPAVPLALLPTAIPTSTPLASVEPTRGTPGNVHGSSSPSATGGFSRTPAGEATNSPWFAILVGVIPVAVLVTLVGLRRLRRGNRRA